MFGTKDYSAMANSYQRMNIKNVEAYKRRSRLRHWIQRFNLHVSKIRNEENYVVADLDLGRKIAVAQVMTIDELEELIERLRNDEEQVFNHKHELFYALQN